MINSTAAPETQLPDDDWSDKSATFGDRIVAAREALGMTSGDLARRMGVKPTTVQNWEEDRSEPRANKLQMLAGVLNVSIIWLMCGDGPGVAPQDGADDDDGVDAMAAELRRIRELQSELASRLMRVERRLLNLRR